MKEEQINTLYEKITSYNFIPETLLTPEQLFDGKNLEYWELLKNLIIFVSDSFKYLNNLNLNLLQAEIMSIASDLCLTSSSKDQDFNPEISLTDEFKLWVRLLYIVDTKIQRNKFHLLARNDSNIFTLKKYLEDDLSLGYAEKQLLKKDQKIASTDKGQHPTDTFHGKIKARLTDFNQQEIASTLSKASSTAIASDVDRNFREMTLKCNYSASNVEADDKQNNIVYFLKELNTTMQNIGKCVSGLQTSLSTLKEIPAILSGKDILGDQSLFATVERCNRLLHGKEFADALDV